MLILTRKRNERIMIGDSIEVIVVDIKGEQVQIGINAPKEIPVHRMEVYEAIVRENGKVVPKTPREQRLKQNPEASKNGNRKERKNR